RSRNSHLQQFEAQPCPGGNEQTCWSLAGVNAKQALKDVPFRQDIHQATAQPAALVEAEQDSSHERRPRSQLSVCALIAREVVALYGISKRSRLPETKAEAFAGDRVDPTRGVADQRHIFATDAAQGMHRGDRAALGADWLGTLDSRA